MATQHAPETTLPSVGVLPDASEWFCQSGSVKSCKSLAFRCGVSLSVALCDCCDLPLRSNRAIADYLKSQGHTDTLKAFQEEAELVSQRTFTPVLLYVTMLRLMGCHQQSVMPGTQPCGWPLPLVLPKLVAAAEMRVTGNVERKQHDRRRSISCVVQCAHTDGCSLPPRLSEAALDCRLLQVFFSPVGKSVSDQQR